MTLRQGQSLSWKKQALFSIIIVSFFVIAGEMAIRTWAFFFRTTYERYNFTTGRLELVPGVRFTTKTGLEFVINSKGFLGREFETAPADGVHRIIAIGDSCTFSSGIWTHAYPGMLENLLNSDGSGGKYEVINGGVEGYNSVFALDRIRQEITAYRPQIVTMYIGWNDLMKTNPENLSATGKYTVLSQVLERSYLVKAYSKIMFQYLRPLVFQPKLGKGDSEDDPTLSNFVPRAYEENLASMIEHLEQQEIKMVLFTLPTIVRLGITRDEIKKQNIFFPHFAGTYSVARFLSLHKAYNDVIRRVGAKFRVPVLDLDQIFNSYGDRKSQLFWDTMHPSREGQILIAEALHKVVVETLRTGRRGEAL